MPETILLRTAAGEREIYRYRPGDLYVEIAGLGIAVRQSPAEGGAVLLFGQGTPGHKIDLDALGVIAWRAACVG